MIRRDRIIRKALVRIMKSQSDLKPIAVEPGGPRVHLGDRNAACAVLLINPFNGAAVDFSFAREMRERKSQAKTLVVNMLDNVAASFQVRAGVAGYVQQDISGLELIQAARSLPTEFPPEPVQMHCKLEAFHVTRRVMAELSRTGVSIEAALLKEFDLLIAGRRCTNRSEVLRDLICDHLLATSVLDPDAEVVGTVSLIYDHHSRLLPEKLTDIQHQHHTQIISTVHAHLDHGTCPEVVVVKGKSKPIQDLANLLIGTKGVQHRRLVTSSPAIAHSSAKHNHKRRKPHP
jgi:CopG family transcriptional regulator, nickel-responsive regulator